MQMVMFLVLKKDKKMICTTRCLDPPIELPQELSLTCEISKNKIHSLSEFPQFSLTPVPNNLREKSEWGNFLNYLCKKDKVALITFKQYQFYILPPALVSTSSPVNVAYNIDNTGSVDTRPRDSESDVSLAGSQLEECGGPNTAEGLKFSRAEETCNEYQSRVPLKNFIRADPSYLKTLGQAHSGWIFGAIAELVDNSKDAKATKMDIFVDIIQLKKSRKDVPMLCLIDDGQGMNHDEVMKMVSFGHKQSDKVDTDRIGKFGVGFKTGAMRLGRDVLVLTQTTTSRSLAFLSQSLNEGKDNIEIPIVSYCRQGQLMEVDLSMQSEALAKYNLKAIKDFSPFNKYLIGEKAALFGTGTGTQIYIWNLDEWGSKYCLEWHDGLKGGSSFHQGDILIQSKRTRSRPGQISQKVPLDYSLRAYLEIIFLVPRMKISVQRTLVKSRPLSKFLTQTVVETGDILRRPVELILGFSQLEWERANCGMFLYWHGRLIEAYKRVGGMTHSADVGRGVIGVVDVTNLMDDEDGRVWVHNNKQGFQDSEQYACLEQWLSRKVDEYWDNNFDALELNKDNCVFKPDHEWVQCDKCRKWRILPTDFDSRKLPLEWFCFMKPFKGQCSDSEQKMAPGIVNVSTKRSGYACLLKDSNDKKLEGDRKTSGAGFRIWSLRFRVQDSRGLRTQLFFRL
ncbi:MORC family CW-type zinc finger protein 3 isoform X2 [Vigna radiata var. radiata]|uniref:MORC family CW-type zinc finger protein 3 isoform X2 n=1 Tax=Vigna radiata var. radiata TaxID=3916 RepID=A0A3Q0EJX1_VIGRR|nr:MORC family CW-type zinc finger protein 3 isoform X2 [Vigna radiata var. radiata]